MSTTTKGSTFEWWYPVVFVLLTILVMVYVGWAVSTLWGWLMVPLGLPAIGIAHAAGISLLLGAARPGRSEYRDVLLEVRALATIPAMMVGIGALLRAWM